MPINTSQYAYATSLRYSSLLREVSLAGKLFVSKHLAFDMQHQTQSNWCWAATATSVSRFYWKISSWTQCLVANAELNLDHCCDDDVPNACNVTWWLAKALQRTNNFVSVTGPASFQTVRDEIDAGRPVGARIGWDDGGGHFMVIYGYSIVGNTNYFDIDDPIYGKSHIPMSEFSDNYQGNGTWTDTDFTKSYMKMPIKFLIPNELILRRIWEQRPLLGLKKELSFSDDLAAVNTEVKDSSLGMAQRVYSLGLNTLLSQETPTPRPVNLRVYELSGARPRALFDVSDTNEPRVVHMSASEKYLESVSRAMSEALSTVDEDGKDCEVRLLRVPALNFEAIWINYEGEERDVLVPIHAVGPLPQYKAVPFYEALKELRRAAAPLANMEEGMGA